MTGASATLKARARIQLDPEIVKHLISITEKDLEIVKLQSTPENGKELNEVRQTLSKFKKTALILII